MAQIFYDKFTETSTTTLTSHTPTDQGTGWTIEVAAPTGVPQAQANDQLRASVSEAGGLAVSAQPNPSTADVDVEMAITNLVTVNNAAGFGVFARWADSSNYYGVQIFPAAHATVDTRLFKKVSGSYTVLASVSSDLGWVASDVLKLELRGSTIKAYKNGVEALSVSDSAITAAGKAGVIWGNMTCDGVNIRNEWYGDDFKVTEVASSGWANIAKVNGIASSGLAKVNAVTVANISKINGVAV